jgi:hypothetical protein
MRKTVVAWLSIVVLIVAQAYSLQPASPELVSPLTKGLSVTPQQATGGGSGLSDLAGSLPGNLGGLVSTATAFHKFGLSPIWSGNLCPSSVLWRGGFNEKVDHSYCSILGNRYSMGERWRFHL